MFPTFQTVAKNRWALHVQQYASCVTLGKSQDIGHQEAQLLFGFLVFCTFCLSAFLPACHVFYFNIKNMSDTPKGSKILLPCAQINSEHAQLGTVAQHHPSQQTFVFMPAWQPYLPLLGIAPQPLLWITFPLPLDESWL